MESDENKRMLFGAVGFALVVVVLVLFQAKSHLGSPSTERELVSHLRATTAAPTVTSAARDFADSDLDEGLQQYVMDAFRELEPGIRSCLERWPEAPPTAKARLKTDAAGRIVTLSIQGAVPQAERCVGILLQNAALPRRADGVIRMEFPGFAPVEEPNQGDGTFSGETRSLPRGEIYWGE
jgi:hypothetical protein